MACKIYSFILSYNVKPKNHAQTYLEEQLNQPQMKKDIF